MTLRDTSDLLAQELRALRGAGHLLLRTLPTVARRVGNLRLRAIVERQILDTRSQLARLNEACEVAGLMPTMTESRGMEGLMIETIDALTADGELPARDAAVVATLQRAAHYQIARYQLAVTHAKLLGLDRLVAPLSRSLDENELADEQLAEIVELELYEQALAFGVTPALH